MRNYFRVITALAVLYLAGVIALAWNIARFDSYGEMRLFLISGLLVMGILVFGAAFLYGSYINKHLIIPLDEMRKFAQKITEGELEKPPVTDKSSIFKPFSESFDIMLDELTKAREREIGQQVKQRELVSSLSSDLKNPVTAIKLTTDLMRTKIQMGASPRDDEYFSERLDNIYKKADQMDVLVTRLLTSALEELGEVKVACADIESHVIRDIIKKNDERSLVEMSPIPFVLIHIDRKNMNRVIGNIISNSYKYAGTKIEANFLLTDDYLQMKISDHGGGVPADELALITDRFYRSRKWANSDVEGSGLGLYISKMIMQKMGGDLLVENTGDGLCVTLLIKLS